MIGYWQGSISDQKKSNRSSPCVQHDFAVLGCSLRLMNKVPKNPTRLTKSPPTPENRGILSIRTNLSGSLAHINRISSYLHGGLKLPEGAQSKIVAQSFADNMQSAFSDDNNLVIWHSGGSSPGQRQYTGISASTHSKSSTQAFGQLLGSPHPNERSSINNNTIIAMNLNRT